MLCCYRLSLSLVLSRFSRRQLVFADAALLLKFARTCPPSAPRSTSQQVSVRASPGARAIRCVRSIRSPHRPNARLTPPERCGHVAGPPEGRLRIQSVLLPAPFPSPALPMPQNRIPPKAKETERLHSLPSRQSAAQPISSAELESLLS